MSINQSTYISRSHVSPPPPPKYNYNINTYTEYRGPKSPTWMERINPSYPTYQSNYKGNMDYFDGLRKKLQRKQ